MWSDDKWTQMTERLGLFLVLCPFLVPQKENELMFVGSAATCCGGL